MKTTENSMTDNTVKLGGITFVGLMESEMANTEETAIVAPNCVVETVPQDVTVDIDTWNMITLNCIKSFQRNGQPEDLFNAGLHMSEVSQREGARIVEIVNDNDVLQMIEDGTTSEQSHLLPASITNQSVAERIATGSDADKVIPCVAEPDSETVSTWEKLCNPSYGHKTYRSSGHASEEIQLALDNHYNSATLMEVIQHILSSDSEDVTPSCSETHVRVTEIAENSDSDEDFCGIHEPTSRDDVHVGEKEEKETNDKAKLTVRIPDYSECDKDSRSSDDSEQNSVSLLSDLCEACGNIRDVNEENGTSSSEMCLQSPKSHAEQEDKKVGNASICADSEDTSTKPETNSINSDEVMSYSDVSGGTCFERQTVPSKLEIRHVSNTIAASLQESRSNPSIRFVLVASREERPVTGDRMPATSDCSMVISDAVSSFSVQSLTSTMDMDVPTSESSSGDSIPVQDLTSVDTLQHLLSALTFSASEQSSESSSTFPLSLESLLKQFSEVALPGVDTSNTSLRSRTETETFDMFLDNLSSLQEPIYYGLYPSAIMRLPRSLNDDGDLPHILIEVSPRGQRDVERINRRELTCGHGQVEKDVDKPLLVSIGIQTDETDISWPPLPVEVIEFHDCDTPADLNYEQLSKCGLLSVSHSVTPVSDWKLKGPMHQASRAHSSSFLSQENLKKTLVGNDMTALPGECNQLYHIGEARPTHSTAPLFTSYSWAVDAGDSCDLAATETRDETVNDLCRELDSLLISSHQDESTAVSVRNNDISHDNINDGEEENEFFYETEELTDAGDFGKLVNDCDIYKAMLEKYSEGDRLAINSMLEAAIHSEARRQGRTLTVMSVVCFLISVITLGAFTIPHRFE